MMASKILKQDLPHIALAVTMTEKENRIGCLDRLDQKTKVVKVNGETLSR
jgi:hypothetical protein